MAYDNEDIGKAIKARLQSVLAAQLNTVEAEYTATDPVTLPDVVTWFEGHKPTVLELDSTAFPFLAVLVPDRAPVDRPISWGAQKQVVTAYADVFVVATTETLVNKIAHRYARAIVASLQGQRAMAGYIQGDYEPRVQTSQASRHSAKAADADMFNEADVDYIQAVRVEIPLVGA